MLFPTKKKKIKCYLRSIGSPLSAFDAIEPDDPKTYLLETKEQVFSVFEATLKSLT